MAKLSLSFPTYRHAPAVTFGRGSLRSLASADDGRTVFLTSAATGVRAYLEDVLARGDGHLSPDNALAKPPGEPTQASVADAAAFIAARNPDRIVAVGGGSVLDWARLSWAAAEGMLDLDTATIDANAASKSSANFCLVPTTCGTGAEAADVAVYTGDDGKKRSVVSGVLAAKSVVLDGRFLDELGEEDLAGFVCDALSHALEASLSLVPGALARTAASGALDLILAHHSSAPGPSDKDRLMEASFLAGVAAANCSVGIVHAFAHSIGVDGVPHGLANALALRDGLRFNEETPQARSLLAARPEADMTALIERLAPIIAAATGNAGRYPAVAQLGDPGYRAELAERMADDVTIRSNPRRPSPEDRRAFVDGIAESLAVR